MDRVSLLILTSAMLRLVPGNRPTQTLRPWWRHNLATALFCKHLTAQDMTSEYGYMCGLMHSVGQLALFQSFPNQYGGLIADTAANDRDLQAVERANFGVDHCELGAALLQKWNIPVEIVDAAAHHHNPENGSTPFTQLVNISCSVSNHLGFAIAPHPFKSIEGLPNLAQELINNENLCLEISDAVDAIEASIGSV
jgi:HD-like signal output (HDOD) protein